MTPPGITPSSARREHGPWRARAGASLGSPLALGRLLFVTFAGVILAFIAGTVLTAARLGDVAQSSAHISAKAMPSLLELAHLGEALHELEIGLDRATASQPPGDALAQVDDNIARIEAAVKSYAENPAFPANRAPWATTAEAVEAVRARAVGVRNLVLAGQSPAARSALHEGVRPAAAAAQTEVLRLIEFDAAEGQRQARQIEAIQQRATALSFLLDGIGAVLSVSLAVVAFVVIRRYTRQIEARSRELEQFASRVAHDIRGPLSPVLFALDRAGLGAQSDAALQKTLERGRSGISRVTALVDDLLGFASAGGKPEPNARASVRRAVDATMEEVAGFAQDAAVELCAESPTEDEVACAPGVLASILSNLVRNAVKYMGDAAVRRVSIQSWRKGRYVRLEVADTGPGLPPGEAERVFEPFVRADRTGRAGLGLGLATVKRLTLAHGGRLGVDSTARGATFWVELPAAS